MEHLMENDVEANENFDNLLGRKAKRRRARRKSDRKRGRKMRLRAKYGGIASGYGRPAPRPNAYADASIGTQVAQEMAGGDALISGGQWIGGGGSSATLNKRGKLGGVIGKLFGRRKLAKDILERGRLERRKLHNRRLERARRGRRQNEMKVLKKST